MLGGGRTATILAMGSARPKEEDELVVDNRDSPSSGCCSADVGDDAAVPFPHSGEDEGDHDVGLVELQATAMVMASVEKEELREEEGKKKEGEVAARREEKERS